MKPTLPLPAGTFRFSKIELLWLLNWLLCDHSDHITDLHEENGEFVFVVDDGYDKLDVVFEAHTVRQSLEAPEWLNYNFGVITRTALLRQKEKEKE